MAEFLVTGVSEMVKKLCSLAGEEFGLVSGVKEEVKKLKHTFETIQAVLTDAEKRQVDNETVKLWLERVKAVAYDADDVLDEFKYEALRREHSPMKSKVRNVFSSSNPLSFRHTMAHKIKEINETLDGITKTMNTFSFRSEVVVVDKHLKNEVKRETYSIIDDTEVFGREDEKSLIVKMLIDPSSQDSLTVIPIVAMGGLGKTTLAQLVFSDKSVEQYFVKRIWICASDDFDVKRLIREMLEYFTENKGDKSNLNNLGCELQKCLSGTRFLLVLDDVWNEDPKEWDDLRPLLSSGGHGSKIIVTTRKDKVADIMRTVPSHRLTQLPENQGWSIFERRAFGSGGAERTANLVKIGKELVKKCGGVPLAIKSVGGLMHSKKNEQDWHSILESKIWNLPETVNGILPALKLSYYNLSSPLKQCFVYCSIFPKDHIIDKKMLIRLWMAEGLIQPSIEGELMEDVGNEYFNSLWMNSFFQDVKKHETCVFFPHVTKHETTCKMHDLARSIAGSEVSIVDCSDKVEGVHRSRHLSVIFSEQMNPEALDTLNELRTFLSFGSTYRCPYHHSILNFTQKILNIKMLRALKLSGSGIEELPSSIEKLIHLRYLDLSNNDIKILPNSITELYNLETLRLLGNWKLEGLPVDMRKMINLRHLEFEPVNWIGYRVNWSGMPKGIGQLSRLQTLPLFVVSNDSSGSSITELGILPHLGGHLWVRHLELK